MSAAAEPGKIIAFYSFKGGTGRTMALANFGCILARRPELAGPILMVDWDLEAPGLHRYFSKRLYGAFKNDDKIQEESPGLIELFIALSEQIDKLGSERARDPDLVDELLREFPVSDYIVETDIPRLHLLKAGAFDGDYAAKIGTFQWLSLYEKAPRLIRAFADRLARDFSYVLIDSRTGLNDTSGICTMLMPEILIAVFTPNRQSVAGVVDIVQKAARYRSQSDDLRPLVVYPLPSRIEASEPDLRRQWRFGDAKAGVEGFQAAFERAFKDIYGLTECSLRNYFDDIQIQHVPKYAYGEELAVLIEGTSDRFSLTRSYHRFLERVLSAEDQWLATPIVEEASLEEQAPERSFQEIDQERSLEEIDQERQTAAYRRRLAQLMHKRRGRAAVLRWAGFASVAVGMTLLVTSAATLLATTSIWLTFAAIVAGTLALGAGYPLVLTAFSQSRHIKEVEENIQAFEARQGPYEGGDALDRLRERTEPLFKVETAERKKKTGRIYISYRRADSVRSAGQLYDFLAREIGRDRIFMDIDSISPGTDFRQEIEKMIGSVDVVLVLIGRNWLVQSNGRRRLNEPTDFVRLELQMADQRGISTIPVLLDNAQMPSAADLPPDVQYLAHRNAAEIRHERWRADVDTLVRHLKPLIS